jgi:hypothetical protein
MITPEDREKYKYHSDGAIFGIKLIGGLTNAALTQIVSDIRKAKIDPSNQPIWATGLVRSILTLMDHGQPSNCLTNPTWVQNQVLEEALIRGIMTQEDFDFLAR